MYVLCTYIKAIGSVSLRAAARWRVSKGRRLKFALLKQSKVPIYIFFF